MGIRIFVTRSHKMEQLAKFKTAVSCNFIVTTKFYIVKIDF